jgi:hypothetical protein
VEDQGGFEPPSFDHARLMPLEPTVRGLIVSCSRLSGSRGQQQGKWLFPDSGTRARPESLGPERPPPLVARRQCGSLVHQAQSLQHNRVGTTVRIRCGQAHADWIGIGPCSAQRFRLAPHGIEPAEPIGIERTSTILVRGHDAERPKK